MLFLAVGLHAAFLFMPLGGAKNDLPKVTEQPIRFNRLPDAKPVAKTAPKAVTKTTIAAKKPTKPIVPPPPLTTPTAKSPAIAPTPADSPPTETADSTPAPPTEAPLSRATSTAAPVAPAVSPSPTPTVAVNQRPNLDQATQEIIDGLEFLEGRKLKTGDDLVTIFPPDAIAKFFTNPDKQELKSAIVGVEYVSPKAPIEIHKTLTELYPDYTFKLVGEYGGGPVYEMKKDSQAHYFNLVKNKDGKETLIVLWKEAPTEK